MLTPKRGSVAVWFGVLTRADAEAYLAEDPRYYEDDTVEHLSAFARDLGGSYDEDFLEVQILDEARPAAAALAEHSYFEEWGPSALAVCADEPGSVVVVLAGYAWTGAPDAARIPFRGNHQSPSVRAS